MKSGKIMAVPGRLTISRSMNGSTDERCMTLTIEDKRSGCILCEIDMTPGDLMLALTNRAGLEGDLHYYPECPVGKTREVQQAVIETGLHYPRDLSTADRERLVAPYRATGWTPSMTDFDNQHRYSRPGTPGWTVTVTMHRFIDGGK